MLTSRAAGSRAPLPGAGRLQLGRLQPVGKDPTDVAIEVPADASAQSVVDALAQHLNADGGRPRRTLRATRLDQGDEPLSSLDLRVGDRLILSPEGPLETRERQALTTRFLFGWPLSAAAWLCGSGSPTANTYGRGDGATVVLDDPSLAEQQVRIRVDLMVHLAGSAPAPETLVEDEPLGRERSVEPGQLVCAGQTLLVFERREPREPPPAGRNGLVPFNRPPEALRPRLVPQRLEAPEPPTETQGMRIPLPAAVLPLFGGLALWLFTKNPVSLVFAALSPLMAIWNYVDTRRRGKSSYGKEKAGLPTEARRAGTEPGCRENGRAEGPGRLAPNAAELVERARTCRPELWERRPEDEDFLALRVGTGTQAALVDVAAPRRGDEALQEQIAELVEPFRTVTNVPIMLPLGALGSAGVSGSPERVSQRTGAGLRFRPPHCIARATSSSARRSLASAWTTGTGSSGSRTPAPPHRRSRRISRQTRSRLAVLLRDLELLEERRSRQAQSAARSRQLPVVLLLLDEGIAPERALIGPMLAEGAEHGIAVLWAR